MSSVFVYHYVRTCIAYGALHASVHLHNAEIDYGRRKETIMVSDKLMYGAIIAGLSCTHWPVFLRYDLLTLECLLRRRDPRCYRGQHGVLHFLGISS